METLTENDLKLIHAFMPVLKKLAKIGKKVKPKRETEKQKIQSLMDQIK